MACEIKVHRCKDGKCFVTNCRRLKAKGENVCDRHLKLGDTTVEKFRNDGAHFELPYSSSETEWHLFIEDAKKRLKDIEHYNVQFEGDIKQQEVQCELDLSRAREQLEFQRERYETLTSRAKKLNANDTDEMNDFKNLWMKFNFKLMNLKL